PARPEETPNECPIPYSCLQTPVANSRHRFRSHLCIRNRACEVGSRLVDRRELFTRSANSIRHCLHRLEPARTVCTRRPTARDDHGVDCGFGGPLCSLGRHCRSRTLHAEDLISSHASRDSSLFLGLCSIAVVSSTSVLTLFVH